MYFPKKKVIAKKIRKWYKNFSLVEEKCEEKAYLYIFFFRVSPEFFPIFFAFSLIIKEQGGKKKTEKHFSLFD